MDKKVIYDLIVVGNGLAAQTFLFELFNQEKTKVTKSQNFSVAQIYADEVSPPCSLRSTATVSLSGIEEGISPLGDELRTSYFLFEEFFKKYSPAGIESVLQMILHSTPEEKVKLERRYQSLKPISNAVLKKEMNGVEMDSYQISPDVFANWLNQQLGLYPLNREQNFVRGIGKNDDGHYECTLMNGETRVGKKIVLATGAYAKIFSHFYSHEELKATQILSGSYLERKVNLNCPSFFITLDGNKCVYRSNEKMLVIGSVSQKGAFESGDIQGLKILLELFNAHLNLPLGNLDDYKIITGLRHKGKQRRPIYKALDAEKNIFIISGFYKNGFTFSHLAAREVLKELNL